MWRCNICDGEVLHAEVVVTLRVLDDGGFTYEHISDDTIDEYYLCVECKAKTTHLEILASWAEEENSNDSSNDQ